MRYFKRITGERLYLSPVDPDDYEIYTKWMNDPEVIDFLTFRTRIFSAVTERKLLEKQAESGYTFAIVRIEDDVLIGNVVLAEVDNISRTAALGIFIGEAKYRSNGYGAEAIRLVLDYGFSTLNLHNVELSLQADNERGFACYQKVGFKECGRRREATFKDGKYIDVISMDILEDEFREKR